MPVPKNGRPTNQGQKRSHEKRPEHPNDNMDNCQANSEPGDLPAIKKTDSFPSSRDSSGSRGKGNNKTGNGDSIINGTGKANGVNCTIKLDDEPAKSSLQGNNPDAHNGVNGSRIFSASGRNKLSYASKTGGGARKLNGQSNGKPDPVFHENADVDPSKPQVLNKSKPADPSIQAKASNGNPFLSMSNEKNNKDAQTKDKAVIKKYSEEPLSFFQPDLGKLTPDEPTSSSVEELCAKWPSIEPKSVPEVSNDRKNLPIKKDTPVKSHKSSPVQQDSRDNSSPVHDDVPTKERYPPKKETLKKWDNPKCPPRFTRNQNIPTVLQSLDGHSNVTNQPSDNSSHAECNSAGIQPSLNFYGSSRRSRQSGDFGNNAWNNGQRSSPRKSDLSGFTHHSEPYNFNGENDGTNSQNHYYSSQGRGQSGPQNAGGWGGPKRNKNGKKFNNQNGYQGDGKKHFGRPGQGQKSPMGQHGKAGTPVGYYSNCDAYSGQNLLSTLPPLMGSQGMQPMMNQMDTQPQMMSPVMHPQMVGSVGPPVQFTDDQQYTMAIFPNGYQWINVGGLPENQQVLVQANGEVVPLTIANVMPYIVPYTSGLPNTGVPMLIPAVAPPMTGVNAQTTMNDQDLNDITGHPDSNAANNPQLYNQNVNGYGPNVTNPPALTISHSVSSYVGPIPACTEVQTHVAQSELEKTWESGTPSRVPTIYPDASNHNQSGASYHQSDTPESANQQNQDYLVSSPVADQPTPGTSLYGSPRIIILNTPPTNGTPSDWNDGGTPGAWNVTPSTSTGTPGSTNDTPGPVNVTPGTPQNGEQMNVKGQHFNKMRMMSLAQVERMQRMSSANGKRVPMNARNKDSPNHMPPAPQEVQEELVKFICDSWNKVHQESLKGSTAVAYYDDPCPQLEGFVPFDLEAYWGKRLVQNMTNQNIPTQNM